jgi:hypothetical protein
MSFNFTLMSNETSVASVPSLENLLDQLGFSMWITLVNTFILPPINALGITFCSFNLWIFLRSKFLEPIFFYYKLLCLVNTLHLIHNIPFCIFFSPLFFPWVNTYALGVFQIYYSWVSSVLFHFGDVLRMGILLHKMKLFSSFVRKHFSASPQIISLAFLLTCVLIKIPLLFAFKIDSSGSYFYVDSNGVEKVANFYVVVGSDFTSSFLGIILLGFTSFFLNQFVTLLVAITLNILSYVLFKSYVRIRKQEFDELQMSSIHNRPTTNRELTQLRHREKTDRKIERNMFYMGLTLCSISIVSRILLMLCFLYYFIFKSFTNSILTGAVSNIIYSLVPTVSIFVFYFFNQMFRDEANKMLFKRESGSNPKVTLI